MKRKCLVIFCIFMLLSILIANFSVPTNLISDKININQSDYLRLHIRGNSNSQTDQETKYAVRDEVLQVIMQATKTAQTFSEAVSQVAEISTEIETLASEISHSKATLEIKNEQFPTREYNGTILPASEYTAVVINLGSGEGDNWWCVAFPPLCYIDGEEIEGDEILLKSKFAEIWDKYFKVCEK